MKQSNFDVMAWCEECQQMFAVDTDSEVVNRETVHEACGQTAKVRGFRLSMSFGEPDGGER